MASAPTLPRDIADRPAGVSVNEALIDLYMERAIDLLRLEAGTREAVFDILEQLEKDVVGLVASIDPTAPARLRYQRDRLTKLLDAVREAIRAAYRGADVLLAQEIREIADIESTWTGRAINAALQIDFVDAGLSREYLRTLVGDLLIQGAPSSDWWSRQAAGLAERFADAMRRGLAIGESNIDLIKRVRGPQGLMNLSRTSAERLVRASTQTVANAAREAMYASNTDIIKALQWHATIDLRTSAWCYVRDGKLYSPTKEHKPIDHDIPWLEGPGKLHWGCRSTSVPVLKSWRDLGIDEDEVPETTRASMDGQVPAQQTFEEWLRKQSVARQNKLLGVSKAELWRRGKLTFRDLLDQDGRPLSTEELRAKASAPR